MALIKNTGSYTVDLGVSGSKKKPGSAWKTQQIVPATGDLVTIDPDMGSGTRSIDESDCRYINASHFGGNRLFVHAVASDNHVLVSASIGPHEFWVFDGMNFHEDERLDQSNCQTCHGS